MENHLTENELIEYQFKLGTQEEQEASSEHLASCAECRERLEKLIKKFTALDLLRADAHVSEELISQVLEQAKQPARQKVIPLYKSPWMGAVAAVLVAGFVLLMSHLNTEQPTRRQFVKVQESKGTPTLEKPTSTQKIAMRSSPQAVSKGTISKMQTAPTKAAEPETISEQPPFAPASAIELVTLPRRNKVQLTIYNSADLTLVRERRNLTLKKGWNWLQFMWADTLIDPTSLSLEPLEQADKIDIQQLVFPARLREIGRWLIRSEISGKVPFEITYFTSGLSWRAFYMGTLSQDEKTMKMQGYVRIGNNSGEDYDNAQTRLIVGKIHLLDQIAQLARRQYPYDRPALGIEHELFLDKSTVQITNGAFTSAGARHVWAEALDELSRKEISKEGLSEYFLYTIEGTETIPNQWGKRLLSFDADDIDIESLYKYDEERWSNQAIRFIKFVNDEKHNLGQTPIPNGNVKIYNQADEQGSLSYIGGTSIKYIPVNEEVELNLGPARLVKVEPRLMDFKTENYIFDNRGNISGWDEIRTWKIEMTNTRTLPIKIEITRGFGTAYWALKSGTPYEKHDATHTRFTLELEPHSKKMLEYTIRTYHGTREESLRQ
jgi:anti-sigma factor RsiW